MVRPADTRNGNSLRLASNGGLVRLAVATGPAGPNTIPTDEAIAAAIENGASDTAAALAASYGTVAVGAGIDPTGVADCTPAVQALIDAMPIEGGRLTFPPGTYKFTGALVTDSPNLELCGAGGGGQDGNVGRGATRLHYTGSGWFFTFNAAASSTIFRGPVLRNLHISGTSSGTGAVRINRTNNYILDNVRVSDFTTGTAFVSDGTGNVNQYGTLDNFCSSNTLNGVDAAVTNGLRIIGGHIEGLSAATGVGIKQRDGGDTLRVFGTNVQGFDYLVDLQDGRNAELHGLRGEDWDPSGSAIRIASDRSVVVGCSLNNTLAGSTGTAIEVTSTASGTLLIPGNITQGVGTPISDSGTDTAIISAEVAPPVVTFAPPSGGNDSTALQAAVNALNTAGGGTLLLQPGTYLLQSTLAHKNKVIIRGAGRDQTILKRSGSLGGDYTVVRSQDGGGLMFSARLEHLTVDADGKEVCVEAFGWQEMAGLSYVILSNFTINGLEVKNASANFNIDNVEVYPKSTGATRGMYIQGASGACHISRVTCGVSGTLTTGIHVYQSTVTVTAAHFETCTDGLLFDDSAGHAVGITGPTGGATVTNLVRMANNSRYVTCVNVAKNGSTNTVKDDFFSKTITDAYVQSVTLGDGYVARLNHYGDKVGFYGTTAIDKQTGVAVTAAGVHAALVNLGLIT